MRCNVEAWVLLTAAILLVEPAAAVLGPGAKFPDFSVRDQNTKYWTLGDFAGERVLFWWCPGGREPGCLKQASGFAKLTDSFKEKGVEAIGISAFTQGKNKDFTNKNKFRFTLLSDEARSISKAVGIKDDHWAALVSADGVIEKLWTAVKDPVEFPNVALGSLDPSKSSSRAEL
mmetsp:Transcript_145817/g.257195  ORF Transcript_145817/g.257195 Transcript_145817/m.257195 type:complete len:174 (-) Transcript_145817:74-595(-)